MWRNFVEMLGNFEKFWEIFGDFATIYALSCGEKFSPKVHLWKKMTNMRFAKGVVTLLVCVGSRIEWTMALRDKISSVGSRTRRLRETINVK